MPRFRQEKARLADLCLSPDWQRRLEAEMCDAAAARAALNPLLGLLTRPECRYQAAHGLGLAAPLIAAESLEQARVLMRRLMWSLNEESGNLGWGAPEAMGCILAQSPVLAAEYARIFLSYGYETGGDDNFIDYAPLRRGVYWGVGRLARSNPEAAAPALPHLTAALGDEDRGVRGMAAFALARLAANAAPGADAGGLARAREALRQALRLEKASGLAPLSLDVLEEDGLASRPVQALLEAALAALPPE